MIRYKIKQEMNLYRLIVSAIFTLIITYMLTIMYIGNKLLFNVLDKNVIYSPLLQQSQQQILPGFYLKEDNNSNVPHYRNISMPMKISLLLLSL